MVGVIVVTHGALAAELLRTASGIVGPLEQSTSVAIAPADTMEEIRVKLGLAMAEVDKGEGVLVLTDMFGGTPANLALSFLNERRVEVVTGCNLPILLKLSTARENACLSDVARLVTAYGQKNIVFASDLIPHVRTETARH